MESFLRVSAMRRLAKKGAYDVFLTGFHPALKTFKPIRACHDTFLAMLKKGVNVIFFSLNFIQR